MDLRNLETERGGIYASLGTKLEKPQLTQNYPRMTTTTFRTTAQGNRVRFRKFFCHGVLYAVRSAEFIPRSGVADFCLQERNWPLMLFTRTASSCGYEYNRSSATNVPGPPFDATKAICRVLSSKGDRIQREMTIPTF